MTIEELLSLKWDARTLAEYERLKTVGETWESDGEAIALRYLQTCYQIDRNPRPIRDFEIAIDPFFELRSRRLPVKPIKNWANNLFGGSEYVKAVEYFILQLLHPQQLPMTRADIEFAFWQAGVEIGYNPLQRRLNKLIDAGHLRRLCNPYKGNSYLYCSIDFCEQVQVGDRVIELLRRRGSRIGTVTHFKEYRDGNLYPVVLWEYSVRTQKPLTCPFESFANPESLVVIERPIHPITRRTAS